MIAVILFGIFLIMKIIAILYKPVSVYSKDLEQRNKFEGKQTLFVENKNDECNADGINGHLEIKGNSKIIKTRYMILKRLIDIILSFFALIICAPVLLAGIIAIKIDDPGPAFFVQKRVGCNKKFYKFHKFRSMKMNTPHDVPTHMMGNSDNYITKVGHFIRNHSLDELPQLWDIFVGNMSFVGPRPALWNQEYLISERDKYNANQVNPGLTGWAQINGRDLISIEEKAKLDGDYVENISLKLDLIIFLRTFHVFVEDDSISDGKKH